MPRFLTCLLIFAAVMTGCAEPNSTADSTAASDPASESGETVVAESSDESPETSEPDVSPMPSDVASSDAGDKVPATDNNATKWLSVPDGISLAAARDYIAVRDMTSDEDPNSLANLGYVSQQFAFFIAKQDGKQDEAYKFLKQAAAGLRAAVKGGVEGIPAQLLSQTFYFEGVALGQEGNTEASLSSLDEAFKNGFTEIDFLMEEDALAAVRESEQWEGKLAEWKELVTEALREEVVAELSSGEKFAFNMTGTSIDGEPISLADLQGKVVIVDFWGTWCPPCRAEIPAFIKLQETYGDAGFQMIGVNYERAPTDEAKAKLAADYVAEHGINYPCMLGDESLQKQVPEFRGYPTTLFIDRKGSVRLMAVGQHSYEYLELVVGELLKEE